MSEELFPGKKIKGVEVPMSEEMFDMLQALAVADGYESAPALLRSIFESYVQDRMEAFTRYEAIFAKARGNLKKSHVGESPNSGDDGDAKPPRAP